MAWIKKVYLYLVSLISLVIIVVGAIMLINLALRTWVFTKADHNFYPGYQCPMSSATPSGNNDVLPPCTAEQQDQFKKQAEEDRSAQKQRDAAQAIAMILVATPVFLYHWRIARKEV